jgi:hypothetical protein
MDAILPDVFSREQIGGLGIILAELTDTSVVGLLSAGTDGQQFQVVGERF